MPRIELAETVLHIRVEYPDDMLISNMDIVDQTIGNMLNSFQTIIKNELEAKVPGIVVEAKFRV